jgi:GH3 auxin-responsive promoter
VRRVPFDTTFLLRYYARRRLANLAALDPVAEQQRQLLRLVRRASATRFGRDHRFAEIHSIDDFQAHVGLHRYEDMWQTYWQASFPRLTDCTWPGTIPFFALTSGTASGTTKYIPCSSEMNRSNARAALDILVHHLADRPDSHVLGGKSFMLGGSTDLTELAPAIFAGDLSGIAAQQTPWWARPYTFPPRDLALLTDWEEKVERLVRACRDEDIRVISGTPSWLLIFFDRLLASSSGSLHHAFPNLELLIHGGVNFTAYQNQFVELLRGSRTELREVYPASEGFFAIADRGPGDGMCLLIDNGIFYEFVPIAEVDGANPTRHWLANISTGMDYAIAVSTNAGVWSSLVGDIVRFVDLTPPRLLVTGRLSYFLSAFGEHLTGEEIDMAISQAAAATGVNVTDYAVGAVFPDASDSRGGHRYVVEFVSPVRDTKPFAQTLDAELCGRNDDYRAHRSGGFGLQDPDIVPVPSGTFAGWMKQRGQLGGQHKVPRVITNPDLFASLCRFVGSVQNERR